jgi:hypothetical protein
MVACCLHPVFTEMSAELFRIFSNTEERPDASLGCLDDQLGIRFLLSCKLRKIFLESRNCLLDACDIDTCHIKAFP